LNEETPSSAEPFSYAALPNRQLLFPQSFPFLKGDKVLARLRLRAPFGPVQIEEADTCRHTLLEVASTVICPLFLSAVPLISSPQIALTLFPSLDFYCRTLPKRFFFPPITIPFLLGFWCRCFAGLPLSWPLLDRLIFPGAPGRDLSVTPS